MLPGIIAFLLLTALVWSSFRWWATASSLAKNKVKRIAKAAIVSAVFALLIVAPIVVLF
jgi:hypothetical protein